MTAINTDDFFVPVTLTAGFSALHSNIIELRQNSECTSTTESIASSTEEATSTTTSDDEENLTSASITGRPTAVTVTVTPTPTPTSGANPAAKVAFGSIFASVALVWGMLL